MTNPGYGAYFKFFIWATFGCKICVAATPEPNQKFALLYWLDREPRASTILLFRNRVFGILGLWNSIHSIPEYTHSLRHPRWCLRFVCHFFQSSREDPALEVTRSHRYEMVAGVPINTENGGTDGFLDMLADPPATRNVSWVSWPRSPGNFTSGLWQTWGYWILSCRSDCSYWL